MSAMLPAIVIVAIIAGVLIGLLGRYWAIRRGDVDTPREANKAAALPELTGTPKQIAWAESIRAEKIAELDGIMKPDAANGEYPEIYAQCMDIINAVKNQTSASYWIDNRTKVFNGRWLQNQHQTKYGN